MINIEELLNKIDSASLPIAFGRITNISAITLMAIGLEVAVGDIVRIESEQRLYSVLGMVTTINDNSFIIVPFSFIEGFKINDKVFLQRDGLTVKCGNGLLGRV
ncbi:EscN/YscN/HrcN family type III secretion system ATPase, partial [Aliarcobacter butzleri]|nr:EscN/YscN/HrcN family type III secretion system ATPase [Aliarcobacter butzleri]